MVVFRRGNIFVVGAKKPLITLPEGDGNYLNILEEKLKEMIKRESQVQPNDLFIIDISHDKSN